MRKTKGIIKVTIINLAHGTDHYFGTHTNTMINRNKFLDCLFDKFIQPKLILKIVLGECYGHKYYMTDDVKKLKMSKYIDSVTSNVTGYNVT